MLQTECPWSWKSNKCAMLGDSTELPATLTLHHACHMCVVLRIEVHINGLGWPVYTEMAFWMNSFELVKKTSSCKPSQCIVTLSQSHSNPHKMPHLLNHIRHVGNCLYSHKSGTGVTGKPKQHVKAMVFPVVMYRCALEYRKSWTQKIRRIWPQYLTSVFLGKMDEGTEIFWTNHEKTRIIVEILLEQWTWIWRGWKRQCSVEGSDMLKSTRSRRVGLH